MLRKPVKPKTEGPTKTSGKNERFKFLKLEDRIAPRMNCHFNENAGQDGKFVGCGKPGGGK